MSEAFVFSFGSDTSSGLITLAFSLLTGVRGLERLAFVLAFWRPGEPLILIAPLAHRTDGEAAVSVGLRLPRFHRGRAIGRAVAPGLSLTMHLALCAGSCLGYQLRYHAKMEGLVADPSWVSVLPPKLDLATYDPYKHKP